MGKVCSSFARRECKESTQGGSASGDASVGPLLLPRAPGISITSDFDSGNIKFLAARGAEIDLEICRDPYTETDNKSHAQWFYFKAAGVQHQRCVFRIINAGKCSYPEGWPGYHACVSDDQKRWFRVPTTYSTDDGVLTISHTSTVDTLWCAYFAPHSREQHQALIARCAQSPLASVRTIGKSLEGRELELIQVGSGKMKAWFTGRQHPGETMAEYWMEGLLERLLDPDDALARQLRKACTFFVVPNMNPDGSVRGYLRTNAGGANLNREWCAKDAYEAPTMKRSPEVFQCLKEMDATGVDFYCDVHGDESTPHNFFAGTHAMPNWTNRHAKLLQTVSEAYHAANPDFGNLAYNYGNDEVGSQTLNTGAEQVGHRFNCLAVTLEQPFKDTYDNHEPTHGWSGARSRGLGASVLNALVAVVGDLRRDFAVDAESLPAWVMPGYACPEWKECSWTKQ